MSGISIPGVGDKYKTNELVEALINQEKIPLEREQKTLDGYKVQKDALRSVNQNMSSLRESARNLYSFDNPFSNKMGISSDEDAISVDPGRNASFESFKIDVLQPATTDRFLSKEIEISYRVDAGKYIFKSGEKDVTVNWKGGTLKDFVTAVNKRSKDIVKATLVGVSPGKQALLLESLQTGEANRLIFEEDALEFAKSIGMIQKVQSKGTPLSSSSAIKEVPVNTRSISTSQEQVGMPSLSSKEVTVKDGIITVPPRGSFSIDVPSNIASDPNQRIEFSIGQADVADITTALNEAAQEPVLPGPGGINFKGIRIDNFQSDTTLPKNTTNIPKTPLSPINDEQIVSIRLQNGSEIPIDHQAGATNEDGSKQVSIEVADYPDIDSIVVRNRNTGKELTLSTIETFNKNADLGFEPTNPASVAQDAKIKYEGITITRPTNDIDDVVPDVTLHVKQKTDRTATIDIKPDTESAKEALITFVGTYNQLIAEINVLTQANEEIISELQYLSDEESEQYKEWLGLFQSDFSLKNGKSTMQTIMSAPYVVEENSDISMLSHLGISTSADSFSSFSASRLRGYLEINEKELDKALENNLLEIKNIFGYDTDGDMVIDSGIAYLLDTRLQSYVQSGGIIPTKISGIDTRIASSETRIQKLETQIEAKEQELKQKYSQMESTLNSLDSQSQSINNTFNKSSGNN
ncbi:MAG: flagellar filament capping protein FliD [Treponema sp.]|nr:flagellar filament capping protein FliD [Treponema sp.]